MGWNTANDIFDPVAEALLNSYLTMSHSDTVNVFTIFIRALQDQDWDTEDESLERFMAWPAVVKAFAKCGVPNREDYDEDF